MHSCLLHRGVCISNCLPVPLGLFRTYLLVSPASPKHAVKTDPSASSAQDENRSPQSVENVVLSWALNTWSTYETAVDGEVDKLLVIV